LPSCKKDDHDGGNANLTAYVQVTNSAMGSAAPDFYLDATKVSTWEVPYGASTAFCLLRQANQAKFENTGSASVNTTVKLTLEAGKYSACFMPMVILMATTKPTGQHPNQVAGVRFINLSAKRSSNVDIAATGGANLVSDLAYKAASAYMTSMLPLHFRLHLPAHHLL
jgi:hypothetical protein